MLTVLSVVLSGCPKPFGALSRTGPLEINVRQEYLTLAWEHVPSSVPQAASAVSHFRLYYRQHGTRTWIMLAEVRARAAPTFMVGADAVMGTRRSGKYDFGVSSITNSGTESEIHSSTDSAAAPYGGWYLRWTRP